MNIECGSFYSKHGEKHLAAVGEVEAMMGLAAMAASEAYGACRVNAGIVGRLDLKDQANFCKLLKIYFDGVLNLRDFVTLFNGRFLSKL